VELVPIWNILIPSRLVELLVQLDYYPSGRVGSCSCLDQLLDEGADQVSRRYMSPSEVKPTISSSDALWISICLIVVVVINMLGAGVYGECEFIFASIKVITITGLIVSAHLPATTTLSNLSLADSWYRPRLGRRS
jgi:hypothetical protein